MSWSPGTEEVGEAGAAAVLTRCNPGLFEGTGKKASDETFLTEFASFTNPLILTFARGVRHAKLFELLQLLLGVVCPDGGPEQRRPAVPARAEEADDQVRQGRRAVRGRRQRRQDDEGVRGGSLSMFRISESY